MQRILLSSCIVSVIGFGFLGCAKDAPTTPANPNVPAETQASKPAAEAPKVEAPKPVAEAPKVEAPKVEAPKAEAPKAETPKVAEGPVDSAVAKMREFIATQKFDKTAKNWRTSVQQPPMLTFDPKKQYFWVLETTEGTIKVRFLPDAAPMHVSSTIYLTEIGFYDSLTFHRVIPGFMAQGGDPLGNGTGGPAYKYAGEFSPTAKHTKPGMLSMANAGPGTDGSQFFLTFVPTPNLDGRHTVFGEVVEGLENLKKLESFGTPGGPTKKPLKIDSAKIVVQ